jgi:hypothetical protein
MPLKREKSVESGVNRGRGKIEKEEEKKTGKKCQKIK